MNEAKQVLDLLNLQVSWLEHVRRARIVVHHGDGENLERHLHAKLTSDLVVFDGLLELGDRVVVLVGELPPVRAQLRYVLDDLLLQLVNKLLELLVDLRQILQVELHLRVKLG